MDKSEALDLLDSAEAYLRDTMPQGEARNRALDLLDIGRGELCD